GSEMHEMGDPSGPQGPGKKRWIMTRKEIITDATKMGYYQPRILNEDTEAEFEVRMQGYDHFSLTHGAKFNRMRYLMHINADRRDHSQRQQAPVATLDEPRTPDRVPTETV